MFSFYSNVHSDNADFSAYRRASISSADDDYLPLDKERHDFTGLNASSSSGGSGDENGTRRRRRRNQNTNFDGTRRKFNSTKYQMGSPIKVTEVANAAGGRNKVTTVPKGMSTEQYETLLME